MRCKIFKVREARLLNFLNHTVSQKKFLFATINRRIKMIKFGADYLLLIYIQYDDTLREYIFAIRHYVAFRVHQNFTKCNFVIEIVSKSLMEITLQFGVKITNINTAKIYAFMIIQNRKIQVDLIGLNSAYLIKSKSIKSQSKFISPQI